MSHDAPINDSILDEIHEEADYLTSAEGEVGKPLNAELADQSNDLGEKIGEDLSDYDVKIKTDINNIQRVHELKDVTEMVLAQETISASDAEEIQQKVGGLYEALGGPKLFTESPTKLNLAETKAHVKTTYQAELEKAAEHHAAYFQELFQKVNSKREVLLNEIQETLLPLLVRTEQRAIQDMATSRDVRRFMAYRVQRNSDGEVCEGSKPSLIDLSRAVLYDGSISQNLLQPLNCLPSDEDIRRYREVIFSEAFQAMDRVMKMSNDVLDSIHRHAHSTGRYEDKARINTYAETLSFLASGSLSSFFTKIHDYVLEKENLEVKEDTPAKDLEEMSRRNLWISDYYEIIMAVERFVMVTKMFVYRCEPILDGFSKIGK